MVVSRIAAAYWLLGQTPPAKQMPPTTKAVVMMALLGIALVGLLLIVFILLGGHWVRRIGSHRRGPSVPPDIMIKKAPEDDQAPPVTSDRPSNETFVDDPTDETRNA